MKKRKSILVTGAAGFIGWKVCEFLLICPELIPESFSKLRSSSHGLHLVGIDNMNDYYDIRLKYWRLKQLDKICLNALHNQFKSNFLFHKIDIENFSGLKRLFKKHKFDAVINLAARAGVRYSMENPFVNLA